MRTYWRNCQEWKLQGLPMSTCSDEACRLYDASLTQVCGYYDEPSLGGFKNSMIKMIEADPEFVMGLVLKNGLMAASSTQTVRANGELTCSIDKMVAMAEKQQVSEREMKHVNAVKLLAEGERYAACNLWRDILMEHPLDLHAARECVFNLFAIGKHGESRDVMSRILPSFNTETPGYIDVRCWRAFGLEETNFHEEAEKEAKQCLEINHRHCFATHALAHVYFEQGKHEYGYNFMESTEQDWNSCEMLANHNYWHQALFSIDKGDLEGTLGIFDTQMLPRLSKLKGELELRDASSLLYRLELLGVNVKDRWQDLKEVCDLYLGSNVRLFTDAHMYFTYLRSEAKDQEKAMVESLKEFIRSNRGDNSRISDKIGLPLYEGLAAHENGDYEKATDILNSIKYEMYNIGGSNAQRDLFDQVLTHSALHSTKKQHKQLGRMLLEERKSIRKNDWFSDKLMEQFINSHAD